MFCMFGVHMEDKDDNRFIRMEKLHPKLHSYCIGGGEYNELGVWKPTTKGLGLGHVLGTLGVKYTKKKD